MLFQPIKIRDRVLPYNVVQGPLAGYSCAPFRRLLWQYGSLGFACSEMISANELVHNYQQATRYLFRHPEEAVTAYQLTGTNPAIFAKAVSILNQQSADIIDINCGCPVKKIRRKGAGSKLLEQPELLRQLIHVTKQQTDALVSIKIRVASPVHDFQIEPILAVAEQEELDFITVHGRHWTQRYDVACQFSAIKSIVEQIKIPVFANGDVANYQSLLDIYNKTGCAGVMIARHSVGQPWLFKQLAAEHDQQLFAKPTLAEQAKLFLQHLHDLAVLENEHKAMLQARSLAKYYARDLTNKDQFMSRILQVERFDQAINLINQLVDYA